MSTRLNTRLNTPAEAADWLARHVRGTLHADSRAIGAGDGFLAWPGAATDARRFVSQVLDAGASACLVEAAGVDAASAADARVAVYEGLKQASAPIASLYFGEPSREIALLAVTGTNGKTSTAWWLAQALGFLGHRAGVIGTLGIGEPGALSMNGLTTPDPVLLQRELRRMVTEGFEACAIEASSIGLAEGRLDGSLISTAIFTNFTQDHLDYHGSMQAYWAAKRRLFFWPGLRTAIINIDDTHGAELAAQLEGRAELDLWTVSVASAARLWASGIRYGASSVRFDVCEGDMRLEVRAGVIGDYNVANLLGVIAALRSRGVPLSSAAAVCAHLTAVPGRLESIALDGLPLAVVDYAHTPDALEKVLQALGPVAEQRGGKLWCVFGCGGDRDPVKRPLMGAAAEGGADKIVITSDNPRSESPVTIIGQIVAGLAQPDAAMVEPDRARAITRALDDARSEDVILIAGKGHEAYQEIRGVKHDFSDRTLAEAVLSRRAARQAGAPA
ncbi:MAG: UDP-N-acetylmuramoyl-L-alanyl-D-glutamate--2,6-diaminopimelate ligase [Pseudomonadota bacterium]